MNNLYDISDMNQNKTDRVDSSPILKPKGTTRTDSNRSFSWSHKGGLKAPSPPDLPKERNGDQQAHQANIIE